MRCRAAGAAIAVLAACGGQAPSNTAPDAGGDAGPAPSGPLDPPSNVRTETGSIWYQCKLLWTPPPQPVDGYEIATSEIGWSFDDGDTHGGIAPGRSTEAVVDFFETSATELTEVRIRIRSRNGNVFSEFSPMVPCVLPVDPPRDAVAFITSAGVTVSWTLFSTAAATVEIEKTELDGTGAPGVWSLLVALPAKFEPFGSTYADPAVAAGKAYGYRVRAVAARGDRSTSVETATPRLGAPLTSTTVQLPAARFATTDGRGHYAFVGNASASAVFTWGTGAPWTSSPAIQATPYQPFVKLDAAGLPHAVYGKPAVSGPGVVITHGWSDGAHWLEETIAQRALQSTTGTPALMFDLDPSGAPVMMWRIDSDKYEAATRVDGAWAVKSLDALLFGFATGYAVFADASGATHLIVDDAPPTHIQLRDGVWTKERVPALGFSFGGPLLGAGRDVDHLVVCFDTFANSFFLTEPACVRRTASGWGEIELLGARPGSASDLLSAQIALSSDGNRVAVLYHDFAALLFRSDRIGAWSELAFAADGLASRTTGFDASGKLFLLSSIPGPPVTPPPPLADYRLSVEP